MKDEQKTPINVFRCPCCGSDMVKDEMFREDSDRKGDYVCGNHSCGISLTIMF